jgi:hypothetical protein
MGQINKMKTNSKRRKRTNDWPLGMYDHCTNQEAFVLQFMSSGAQSKKRGGINLPHKPLRAMVTTSIPAAWPIIINLEQFFWWIQSLTT